MVRKGETLMCIMFSRHFVLTSQAFDLPGYFMNGQVSQLSPYSCCILCIPIVPPIDIDKTCACEHVCRRAAKSRSQGSASVIV